MNATSILELLNVSRSFGGLTAVDALSLKVEQGSITSLIGPNGAGKTTVFNLISNLISPSAGQIFFEGRDVTGRPPHQIARLGVGRTFQDPRIFREMTVLDQVLSGFSLPDENPLRAIFRGSKVRAARASAVERAFALLDQVGLLARAGDLAQDLSFGEQRFLSIARVLARAPRLLMLDEPSVGLDINVIGEFKKMITRLVRDRGTTVLIIEHNLDVIFEISDHIHLLVGGKAVLSGKANDLKRHPTMLEAYLGDAHVALSA
jgi:branched-chain amino acid transport system ATP-binding protein